MTKTDAGYFTRWPYGFLL